MTGRPSRSLRRDASELAGSTTCAVRFSLIPISASNAGSTLASGSKSRSAAKCSTSVTRRIILRRMAMLQAAISWLRPVLPERAGKASSSARFVSPCGWAGKYDKTELSRAAAGDGHGTAASAAGCAAVKSVSVRRAERAADPTIKSYQILTGDTHSGYLLDLHESELPAGMSPHPPHKHVHEEILFIREGEVEVTINGQSRRLGPGSCAFMASNDLHGYRNSGTRPAKYFVLALGGD